MDEFEDFPEDVRAHLAEQGSDLTLPHNLDLYLYYPSEAAAQEVAALFLDSPMESDVVESDQPLALPGPMPVGSFSRRTIGDRHVDADRPRQIRRRL